jgi:predicted ATPase
VPVIRSLDTFSLTSRICFFAGENGSGSRFQRNGLFLLDEPEAALSPQRQLPFLVLLHDTLRKHKDAQFIISSHSPLLLGYPEAQMLSFDGGKIHEIGYEDLQCVQIARRFLNHRENFLQQLLNDPPRLFPPEE